MNVYKCLDSKPQNYYRETPKHTQRMVSIKLKSINRENGDAILTYAVGSASLDVCVPKNVKNGPNSVVIKWEGLVSPVDAIKLLQEYLPMWYAHGGPEGFVEVRKFGNDMYGEGDYFSDHEFLRRAEKKDKRYQLGIAPGTSIVRFTHYLGMWEPHKQHVGRSSLVFSHSVPPKTANTYDQVEVGMDRGFLLSKSHLYNEIVTDIFNRTSSSGQNVQSLTAVVDGIHRELHSKMISA